MRAARQGSLSSAEHGTLVDAISEEARRAILSGRFVLGQRLIEADMTRELGVSRGAWREAVRRLSVEGLIELVPHRGVVVRRLTRQEVADRYRIRETLEGLAASLAAERISTAAERRELTAACERSRQGSRATPHLQPDANYAFHQTISRLSGNPQLAELVERLWIPSQMVLGMRGTTDAGYWPASDEQHEAILRAILAGDPSGADRAMRTHLRSGCERILQMPAFVFEGGDTDEVKP